MSLVFIKLRALNNFLTSSLGACGKRQKPKDGGSEENREREREGGCRYTANNRAGDSWRVTRYFPSRSFSLLLPPHRFSPVPGFSFHPLLLPSLSHSRISSLLSPIISPSFFTVHTFTIVHFPPNTCDIL